MGDLPKTIVNVGWKLLETALEYVHDLANHNQRKLLIMKKR